MKRDALRIDIEKTGGMFFDGPDNRGHQDIWTVWMRKPETGERFALAVGGRDEAIKETIDRLETIIHNLNDIIEP